MNYFGKITLFLSKCYKLDVGLVQCQEVHHLFKAVLDSEAGPNMVRKKAILTFLTRLTRPMKTFQRSARDTTFRVRGIIRIPTDFRGDIVHIVFIVALLLATKMILRTIFIDKSMK